MSATAQPSATGMTAQAESARPAVDYRRKQEDALVGAGRDDRLLEHEFQQVGEGLQQAEGSNHIRPAPHLYRGPHLAVGIEQEGDEDQEDDEQQQALPDDEGDGQAIARPELSHRCRSPLRYSPYASRSGSP